MENIEIYEKVRTVPKTAQKPITAGRLKGMTDINPMWRIKMLTELFGPCGIGWKYEVVDKWIDGSAKGEVVASVQINLYIKVDGEWSAPIPGIGGSKLAASERSGVYVSDECYKMALTDAISVSCKALGMAADIYWDKDTTKYTERPKEEKKDESQEDTKVTWREKVIEYCRANKIDMNEVMRDYNLSRQSTEKRFKEVYEHLSGGAHARRN